MITRSPARVLAFAMLAVGAAGITCIVPDEAQATLACTGDVFSTSTICGQQNATTTDVKVGGSNGGSADGHLYISGGSILTTASPAPAGSIGDTAGTTGTVTVAGALWHIIGTGEPAVLNVGRRGEGNLAITGGGFVALQGASPSDGPSVNVGGTANGAGTGNILIHGANSALSLTCPGCAAGPGMDLGRRGDGTMDIQAGGKLVIDGFGASLTIARGANDLSDPASGDLDVDSGEVTINGLGGPTIQIGRNQGDVGSATFSNNSKLSLQGEDARIFIGRDGQGRLELLTDSILTMQGTTGATGDTGIQISRDGNSDGNAGFGELLVDDSTASITAENAFINVGSHGTGTMTVQNGGVVNLNGAGGYSFLGVGREGNGTLEILSGGKVNVTNTGSDTSVFVATDSGSVGAIVVDGAGSELDAGNLLAVGLGFDLATPGGTGTVNVRNGGVVKAAETHIGANGFLGGNGTVVGTVYNDGGTVGPGLSPGHLIIDGDFIQTSGVLEIEIAGLLPGQFDVLEVTGLADFTGSTILFSFLDDFLPQTGDVVEFLTAGAIAGLGAVNFLYEGAAPGFAFNIDGGPGGSLNFIALSNAVASVPEPSTLLLFAVGLLGLFGATRMRATSQLRAAPGLPSGPFVEPLRARPSHS